jgi:uncharacterized membrane protein YdbT with pleckstrin-like domain
MGYIEKHLIPGEHVVFKTRLHTITILFHMIMGVALVLLAGFCFYQAAAYRNDPNGQSKPWALGGAVMLVIGFLVMIIALLKRNATEMAVTNRRVLIKTGMASRRTIELLLANVESIVITEPFLGRMLGYGTVIVRGTGGTPEPFDRIAKPTEFRRCVQEQSEAVQGK